MGFFYIAEKKKGGNTMIQKAIRKLSLPLFASAGITAAGLILYQRISLHRASRKGDKTPFESYTTPDGVSMAYERFGYGRPVVLLHSLHHGNGIPRSKNWQKIFGYTP